MRSASGRSAGFMTAAPRPGPPALATGSPTGAPQARTGVLPAADRTAARLRTYTDLHSPKVGALRVRPLAALQVRDSAAHLPIRLMARARILSGAALAELWAPLPHP